MRLIIMNFSQQSEDKLYEKCWGIDVMVENK